jgi:hypothetical protein
MTAKRLKSFRERFAERKRLGRIALDKVRKPINEGRGDVQYDSFPDMKVAVMALRSDLPVDEKLSRLASFSDAVSQIDASDVMVTAMWVTPSE